MSFRRFLLLGLPLLLAGVILVPVLADAPKDPTGHAPFEVLVTKGPGPTGVAVAPDGTVFFTDRKEGRLWQRAPHGRRTRLLDRLEQPRGLVRGTDGTLYLVADGFRASKKGPGQKGVLLQWSPDEGTVTVLAEDFTTPQQLALDKDGFLLLSTTGGRRQPPEREQDEDRDDEDDEDEEDGDEPPTGLRGTIVRVHPETGQILVGFSGFRRPSGVVGDAAGTLTVAAERFTREKTRLNGSLFQIDPHGNVTRFVHERFTGPAGLVRDALGVLFLAVQRDREHPKEDGLILKVAPDGSFTRFAHGFERPWGLTFDPQGNLYISDPQAGKIYRFLAPAPPTLAILPETTTQSSIEVSGTAEPAARITVRGGVEEGSTAADLEGQFALDIPLLPNQVNNLKVYATGAQGDGLTSAPASTTIHQQTTPPPPSITIVLQITNPAPGATITADSVLVRGFVDAGGLEVGVTVNAGPAAIVGNTFAALVSVGPDTTTLTAIATTATGVTATQRISISVTPAATPGMILYARPGGGVAPLTVGFAILGGPTPQTVELDVEGDGTIDFTGPGLEGQTFTYGTPGVYAPKVKLTAAGGQEFRGSAVVQVHDRVTLDAQLQPRWNGLKDALRAGDVNRGVTFIHSDTRAGYQEQLGRLRPATLAEIDRWMTTIQLVRVGPGGALYEMLRERNGKMLSFAVWFQIDQDGFWRLRRF